MNSLIDHCQDHGEYDSREETMKHINNVRSFIGSVIEMLEQRAEMHDASKLEEPEKSVFDKFTPLLSSATYGSDEYREILGKMTFAIDHHQRNNRHHPEYFPRNFYNMNLIDLIELLCDWKAATMRHADGDIMRSIEINAGRFKMPAILISLLINTVRDMRWGV